MPRRDRAEPRPGRDQRLDRAVSVPASPSPCGSFAAAARSSRRRSSTRSRAASSALISSVPSSAASRARRIRSRPRRGSSPRTRAHVLHARPRPRPGGRPEAPARAASRQRPREVEQTLLRRPCCDPRQRPHLRERELAPRERRPRRRQLLQRLRDPHELPRLTRRDPQRHATKLCRSLLSPCLCISHTSSSQRAVAALKCADKLASSSTRCSVAASRAATSS